MQGAGGVAQGEVGLDAIDPVQQGLAPAAFGDDVEHPAEVGALGRPEGPQGVAAPAGRRAPAPGAPPRSPDRAGRPARWPPPRPGRRAPAPEDVGRRGQRLVVGAAGAEGLLVAQARVEQAIGGGLVPGAVPWLRPPPAPRRAGRGEGRRSRVPGSRAGAAGRRGARGGRRPGPGPPAGRSRCGRPGRRRRPPGGAARRPGASPAGSPARRGAGRGGGGPSLPRAGRRRTGRCTTAASGARSAARGSRRCGGQVQSRSWAASRPSWAAQHFDRLEEASGVVGPGGHQVAHVQPGVPEQPGDQAGAGAVPAEDEERGLGVRPGGCRLAGIGPPLGRLVVRIRRGPPARPRAAGSARCPSSPRSSKAYP